MKGSELLNWHKGHSKSVTAVKFPDGASTFNGITPKIGIVYYSFI